MWFAVGYVLKMNNLVNEVASKASDKWFMIGVQLNIKEHDNRASKPHDQSEHCYLSVFELYRKTKVHH